MTDSALFSVFRYPFRRSFRTIYVDPGIGECGKLSACEQKSLREIIYPQLLLVSMLSSRHSVRMFPCCPACTQLRLPGSFATLRSDRGCILSPRRYSRKLPLAMKTQVCWSGVKVFVQQSSSDLTGFFFRSQPVMTAFVPSMLPDVFRYFHNHRSDSILNTCARFR